MRQATAVARICALAIAVRCKRAYAHSPDFAAAVKGGRFGVQVRPAKRWCVVFERGNGE